MEAGTRITLIDDHDDFRAVLSELLTEDGYEVTALSGDRTTLEEIAATQPSLLILDLILPGGPDQMSGWDYLKLMRAHRILQSVPVLVCSGDLDALQRRQRELRDEGRLAVLSKPFSVEQAEHAVRDLLRARRVPEWDDGLELVLVADAASHLVDASSAALRALGMSIEELRRKSVTDIVAQDPDWTQAEWQRYRHEGHWQGAVTLRHADGRELDASASAEILEAAGTEWHISRLQLAAPSPRK